MWCGVVLLPDGSTARLALRGRKEPAADDLALVSEMLDDPGRWRSQVESALRDHASDAGAAVGAVPPPVFMAVVALDGTPTVELGFEVPLDDEYTVGVCIRDGVVIECNGSVLEP